MPRLKSLARRAADWTATRMAKTSSAADADLLMQALKADIAARMPDNPVLAGWRAYAQCDEDGILIEVMRRVAERAPLARTVIEIGASSGLENMTHALLLSGFRGFWVEGSGELVGQLTEALGGAAFPRLKVVQSFVTTENIGGLVVDAQKHFGGKDIDVFSMDVDGNDIHLTLAALKECAPKVIVAEYNGKFPPPLSLTVAYNPTHRWAGDDFYGVTLQRLVDDLPGYRLVSCNLSGVNAFFVREDLAGSFTLYPVEQLFQPSRLHLVGIANGHKPSLGFLRQYVNSR
jgi:hypothetical protein